VFCNYLIIKDIRNKSGSVFAILIESGLSSALDNIHLTALPVDITRFE